MQRDDKGPPSFQLLNVSSVGFCRFGRHMGRPRLDNIGKKAGQCLRICHRVTPSVITPRTILSIYHICKMSALQPAVHNTCATDNGREFCASSVSRLFCQSTFIEDTSGKIIWAVVHCTKNTTLNILLI